MIRKLQSPLILIVVSIGVLSIAGCGSDAKVEPGEVEGLDPALRQAVETFHKNLHDENLKMKIMRVRRWSLDGAQYATLAVYHKHMGDYPTNIGCPSLTHRAKGTTGCDDTTWYGGREQSAFGSSAIFHLIVLQAAMRNGEWTVGAAPEDILPDKSYLEKACAEAEKVIDGLGFSNETI